MIIMYKNVYGYISVPRCCYQYNVRMSLEFFYFFINTTLIFVFLQMWITSVYNTEEK